MKRDVKAVRRGPIRQARNGKTSYEWAVAILTCGHEQLAPRLRRIGSAPPWSMRCERCEKEGRR